MNARICPTITAYDPSDYRVQLQRVAPFAKRLHIDFMDGQFASPKSISLGEAYWPDHIRIDLHLMYHYPARHTRTILSYKPFTVIVHAEADGEFLTFADTLHQHGIGVGVALLPETPVEAVAPALHSIDHILIFSGKLGHNGGIADLNLLHKVRQLQQLKPQLEIGWDGGINASNAAMLVRGGIDVLNVGGFIQHATDPARAYATLEAAIT